MQLDIFWLKSTTPAKYLVKYIEKVPGYVGQWLWLSWQSSLFRNQRSAVRIQSSAKFYNEQIYCELLKRRKEKEAVIAQFFAQKSLVQSYKSVCILRQTLDAQLIPLRIFHFWQYVELQTYNLPNLQRSEFKPLCPDVEFFLLWRNFDILWEVLRVLFSIWQSFDNFSNKFVQCLFTVYLKNNLVSSHTGYSKKFFLNKLRF